LAFSIGLKIAIEHPAGRWVALPFSGIIAMTKLTSFQNLLVATDFSPHADAALQQAIWVARHSGARITLVHVLPDLNQTLLAVSTGTHSELIYNETESLQREAQEESLARMHFLISKLGVDDLDIKCEVLLGDPSIAIIREVQHGHFDTVFVGVRNQSAWERFIMGSTAKRLIRKCPSLVWTVNAASSQVLQKVLVATDFSDVSRRAVLFARHIARRADAELHVVHIIDWQDLPPDTLQKLPAGTFLHEGMISVAQKKLEQFTSSIDANPEPIFAHVSWGDPASDIPKLARQLNAGLLVLGSVGRSGIKGVFLGNTAEKLLDSCECSVLTVKPEGFISPIEPGDRPQRAEQNNSSGMDHSARGSRATLPVEQTSSS
jgi:nucleotide-binding universal stress UspA family protein